MKTVSLELSKQLKESGYPQETEFCYYRNADEYHFLRNPTINDKYLLPFPDKMYASPTSDEIFDELPKQIKGDHPILYLAVHINDNYSTVVYETFNGKIKYME